MAARASVVPIAVLALAVAAPGVDAACIYTTWSGGLTPEPAWPQPAGPQDCRSGRPGSGYEQSLYGGRKFELNGISWPFGTNLPTDWDVAFFDAGHQVRGFYGHVGDEAGNIPAGSAYACLYLNWSTTGHASYLFAECW